MPYHILGCERDKAYILYPAEHPFCHIESRHRTLCQILLGLITGHHDLGIKAYPRQEHLHLGRRRILSLVKYDEGIIKRPASHIRQRRHLYKPLFHILLEGLRSHYAVKGGGGGG